MTNHPNTMIALEKSRPEEGLWQVQAPRARNRPPMRC